MNALKPIQQTSIFNKAINIQQIVLQCVMQVKKQISGEVLQF